MGELSRPTRFPVVEVGGRLRPTLETLRPHDEPQPDEGRLRVLDDRRDGDGPPRTDVGGDLRQLGEGRGRHRLYEELELTAARQGPPRGRRRRSPRSW